MLSPVNMDHSLEEVTAAHPLVLVDFSAEWCEPCKWVLPVLDEVEKKFSGKLKLHMVDIDQHTELARTLHILSVPTLVLYQNGKEIWRMRGFDSASVITSQIN